MFFDEGSAHRSRSVKRAG